MVKKKFCVANLVYGNLYPSFWCENHIKSLLDPTNFHAIKNEYDIDYAVFTDEETLTAISRHPNFMALGQVATINVVKIGWPPDSDRFASRYHLLLQMLQQAVKHAVELDAYLSVWVADLVFAKDAIPRILSHLERGHDAVFNVPIRGAADSMNITLASKPGALPDMELFTLAYQNLHHLWVASHWNASLFSKFPYSILWNSGSGLLAHNFSVTPIAFKPTKEMMQVQGGIDTDLPNYFKNPYWATDWTDAPVAGVEPLSNGHYPPFLQHQASLEYIKKWASMGVHPDQFKNLDKPLFYPNRSAFANDDLANEALGVAKQIQGLEIDRARTW